MRGLRFSLLSVMILPLLGQSLYAIEYFDITQLRFHPLRIGFLLEPTDEATATVMSSIQRNLEAALYFQTDATAPSGTLPAQPFTFQLSLQRMSPLTSEIGYEFQDRKSVV